MLGINPTPFDLQFHLGRIPVRVHPGFWLVGAIGGWYPEDLRITFIWMICLFVSILVHELGHALIGEAFGWPSEILLYHFGGLAFSQRYYNNTPWRSIAVSVAGPAAGFALYGLVVVLTEIASGMGWMDNIYLQIAAEQLERINLWWGIINLVPVLPLDGGRVCESLLQWFRIRDFETRTAQVGVLVGGLMAWWFLTHHERFAGMLFLFLALQNFSTLQQNRNRW
jgi:stage IV sporulation protein FB